MWLIENFPEGDGGTFTPNVCRKIELAKKALSHKRHRLWVGFERLKTSKPELLGSSANSVCRRYQQVRVSTI
jgi:hypothetical protein